MRSKTFAKTVITLVFVLLPLFFSGNKAYAQTQICQPSEGLYQRVVAALETLDIRRTAVNFLISAATDVPMQAIANGTTDDITECVAYLQNEYNGQVEGAMNFDTANCTYDADYCRALFSTYDDNTSITGTPEGSAYFTKHANSRVSGSLIGLVNLAENATYQPLPVNLAYYVNREAQNIPFVGTAFAQSSTDFTGPFLNITYDMWKMFRDAAYGIMAIIMVVIGIMIMTRKKLNPQTAVTMQYALPRVIIALVLITFSYVIGATIASVAYALKFNAFPVISDLYASTPNGGVVTAFAGFGAIANLAIAFVLMLSGGVGVVFIAVWIVGLVLSLAIFLLIFFKMLFIYLRMVVNIIAAPITFTIATIPGKDDLMIGWFKQMAVYTLSIFGMSAGIALTKLATSTVLYHIVQSPDNIGGALALSGSFLLFGPFLIFFIWIYGLNITRTIPSKIEAAIMGPKKK